MERRRIQQKRLRQNLQHPNEKRRIPKPRKLLRTKLERINKIKKHKTTHRNNWKPPTRKLKQHFKNLFKKQNPNLLPRPRRLRNRTNDMGTPRIREKNINRRLRRHERNHRHSMDIRKKRNNLHRRRNPKKFHPTSPTILIRRRLRNPNNNRLPRRRRLIRRSIRRRKILGQTKNRRQIRRRQMRRNNRTPINLLNLTQKNRDPRRRSHRVSGNEVPQIPPSILYFL